MNNIMNSMFRKRYIYLILSLLCGCIENDIPYPIVKAEIKAFEVSGQISSSIDAENRIVTVELDDSVYIRQARLLRFEVSDGATVSPEISAIIDLSSPMEYTLTTYQDYVWEIRGIQTVTRYIKMNNQIGEALFDTDTRMALVTVAASENLSNITVNEMKLGPAGSVITPDPATVHDFSSLTKFSVTYHGNSEEWSIRVIKSAASVVTGDVNAWAKYASVTGQFQSGSGTPTFQYKKSTELDWITLSSNSVTINSGTFNAELSPLDPETEYVFRAKCGEITGAEKTFTTESTLQLINSNFDDWIKGSDAGSSMTVAQQKSWFPNKDLSDAYYWWDSGNIGSNSLSEKNPTTPESSIVIKGKAAKLTSMSILGVFAAGSIYAGKYLKTDGVGAQLSFGRPFKGRPKGLKGYYSYSPGKIDKTKDPYTSLSGKSDTCHIYAILTDWSEPFTVNTKTGSFVDLNNDSGIIAICQLKDGTDTNGYKEFNLEFKYKSLTRKPNYIVLVAAASKYGDYFTGSTDTVMYVDEFELVY